MATSLPTKFLLSSLKGPLNDVFLAKDGILAAIPASKQLKNSSKSSRSFVPYADIVGASVERDLSSLSVAIKVYAYPKEKSMVKKEDRRLRVVKFHTLPEEMVENDNDRAEAWKKELMKRVRGKDDASSQRQFLVFVNPASGRGKAEKIYQTFVAPVFEQAEIKTEVIVTERRNHAKEMVQTRDDLYSFDAIIIVSGDGLHYEVINGLMARPDWAKAMKIPLGAIPGGSGNSLVCSLLHLANEPFTPTCAAFACVKGRSAPLDILSVHTPTQTLYSFLSLTWGLVSDIDIKSENYRWLGEARFTAGFISQLASFPKYRGKLCYLPVSQSEALATENPVEDSKDPYLLSSFDEPLREENGWKILDGEFITIAASLLTHIGSDLFIAPPAHLAGGVFYVYIVPSSCSRVAVLKAFLKMERGLHVDVEGTELIGVKAMRLEPEAGGRGGMNMLCVDGEKIEYGSVQAQVLRGLGRVLILKEEKLVTEREVGTPV